MNMHKINRLLKLRIHKEQIVGRVKKKKETEEPKGVDHLSRLPTEIVDLILSDFSERDLAPLRSVNTRFGMLASQKMLKEFAPSIFHRGMINLCAKKNIQNRRHADWFSTEFGTSCGVLVRKLHVCDLRYDKRESVFNTTVDLPKICFSFNYLVNLTSLSIQENQILSKTVVDSIVRLPKLLNFHIAQVHELSPDYMLTSISELSNLETLALENCGQEDLAQIFEGCSNLRVISLKGARGLSQKALNNIGKLKKIKTIELMKNDYCDPSLDWLVNSQEVTTLCVNLPDTDN